MYQFQPRLTKILKSSEDYQLYYATNRYTTSGLGMPNCTAYALGRVNTLQALNGLSYNNYSGFYGEPKDWGNSGTIGNDWVHSDIPKLGCVAVFSDLSGEGGHVGIVEQIFETGNVTLSNSGWVNSANVGNENASTWWYLNSNINIKTYRSGTFRYYLYPPFIQGDTPTPEPPKPTPTKKSWIPLALVGAMKNNI